MKNQVERLKRVIESDRTAFYGNGTQLVVKDLKYVLAEYFHLTEEPRLNVIPVQGGYRITLDAFADFVCPFQTLP